jgi:3-hydroxy acid dehydrogenase/malonic semialdehyde reductase
MDHLRVGLRSLGFLHRLASSSASPARPALSARTNPFHQITRPGFTRRTMASAMAKRLEGKTIVVTGASAGIGKSTAKEFARTSPKNLKIILTARRVDALNQIAQEIKEEVGDGVKVLPVKMDVSNPEEVRNFVPSLPEEFKEIDVLVNNA